MSNMTTCNSDSAIFRVKDSDVQFRFLKVTEDVSRFLMCCKEKKVFEKVSVQEQIKKKKPVIKVKKVSPKTSDRHTRLLKMWSKSTQQRNSNKNKRPSLYHRPMSYGTLDVRGPSQRVAHRVQPPLLRSKRPKSHNTIDMILSPKRKKKRLHQQNSKAIAVRTVAVSSNDDKKTPLTASNKKKRAIKSFSPAPLTFETSTPEPLINRKRKLCFEEVDKKTPNNNNQQQQQQPTVTPNMNMNLVLKKRKSSFVSRTISSAAIPRLPIGTSRPFIGFRNIGNTCYMNAALQIILRIPTFVKLLESHPISNSSEPVRSCLLSILKIQRRWTKLRQEMSKNTTDLTSLLNLETLVVRHLSTLKRTVAQNASEAVSFSGFRQQDSHEWIGNFLEALDLEMEKTFSNSNEDELLEKLPTRFCFHTELKYTLRCTSCNYSRDKIECFRDLSIEIPQSQTSTFSLRTILSQHFEDESVELRCEKCKGERAVISPCIKKCPPVLMIHLKRFHLNMYTGNCVKLNTLIDAPEMLKLNGFVDCAAAVDDDKDFSYVLKGIVRHHGRSVQGGHYTVDMSLKKTDDGSRSSSSSSDSSVGDDEKWYQFDDSRVSAGMFGKSEKDRLETGYVLIYVKKKVS